MIQLLIVDDEVESLEWLEEIFEQVQAEEICIYTASSGKKAIEILNRVKCDVVLTDIKMPGMDGVELYQHVKENWPLARVVFLTGYSTHEMLYQIAQDKEVRYLIKTESPEKIRDTVLLAYRELKEKQDNMVAARQKEALLDRAKYWLQKEMLERLLWDAAEEGLRQEQLDALEFPVNLRYPVLLFLGKVNTENGRLTYEQQESVLFIVRENLPGIMKAAVYILESSYVLGIVQPRLTGETMDWKRHFHTCVGALENTQEICGRQMELKVPFSVYERAVSLSEAGQVYYLLKEKLMTVTAQKESGVFLTGMEKLPDNEIDNRYGLIRLPMLENYLEQRNFEKCIAVLKEITTPLLQAQSMHDIMALELYYNVSMTYLKYINAYRLGEKIPFYIGIYPLLRADDFESWKEAADYLMRLTDALFCLMDENEDAHNDQAMERVEQYIHGHLQDDLSLQVLAEVGGFNASY
ncbi:MAG: response regulator, partial [Lachnospiraceae bacterium]|nr:response regulator [Lachnospiraceae bacterium]